jgi:hypothetical protein
MELMIEEIKKLNKEFHVINGATKYVGEAAKEGWSDCDASLLSVYINKKLNNYL